MKSRRGSRSKISLSSPPLQLCDRLENIETKTDIGKNEMYASPIPSSTPVAQKIFDFCQRKTNIHFIPPLLQQSRGLSHVPKASFQLLLGWVFFQFCTNQSLLNARRQTGEFPCHEGKEKCIQGKKWVTRDRLYPPIPEPLSPW